MTSDPRTIGHDPRRFSIDGEDRARLEAFAASTNSIVDIEPTATGVTLRHTSATGRVREASGVTAADALRRLADALGGRA